MINKNPLITVVLCNWKSHDMLKACVNSLLTSFTVDTDIKVVLNESDKESINFLHDHNIDFVSSTKNLGCAAVDLVTPMVNSPYIITVNDDQLFSENWQNGLLELYKDFYPVVPCSTCVELEDTNNSMVEVDNLGDILSPETLIKFRINCNNGKYNRLNRYGYNHPALFKTSDWKAVGGYSLNIPFDTFGLGGYCLDDAFNYKIWKLYNESIKFVVSGNSFVYHYVSYTGKRLPAHIKNFNAHGEFLKISQMSTSAFRSKIKWGEVI